MRYFSAMAQRLQFYFKLPDSWSIVLELKEYIGNKKTDNLVYQIQTLWWPSYIRQLMDWLLYRAEWMDTFGGTLFPRKKLVKKTQKIFQFPGDTDGDTNLLTRRLPFPVSVCVTLPGAVCPPGPVSQLTGASGGGRRGKQEQQERLPAP